MICLFGDEHDRRGAVQGYDVWWVAPDYPIATIGWREIKGLARQVPGAEVRESERRIEFPSGGFVQAKSAHDEGSLRGEGLDRVVIDEAAFLPSADRWNSEIRPALADKKGAATLLSTFNGENFFYDFYQLGQDPSELEWESWRQPTSANPWIDPAEVEAARRNTPEAQFEQEWMANPLVYVGAVFKGGLVQEAIERGVAAQPDHSHPAYAGLDWGYANETALEVCREHPTENGVHWFFEKTWKTTELNERCRGIAAACKRFGVRVVFADAAGATENRTLLSHLEAAGTKTAIKPVPFGRFKEAGIATRRWYLENGLESLGTPKLARDTKRYRYKEGREEVEKVDDHTVDAATAFYSARRRVLMSGDAR